MRHTTAFVLALSSLLLLSACTGSGGSSGPSDTAPGGNDPRGVEGRTFLSMEVEGRDLVAGSTVRLVFDGGTIRINAGCNTMGGRYAIDGDIVRTDQMGGTEMACDPALMAQDAWIAELLNGATIRLGGDTLTLTRGDTTVTLTDREVADPDRPILGTRWVLDGIIAADAVSSVPAGVTAALTFSEGRVDVEAGCNSGGGGVEVTDTTLAFSAIALTRMACEPDAMAVESAMSAVLDGTVGYEIEADVLTLRSANAGLSFRASP